MRVPIGSTLLYRSLKQVKGQSIKQVNTRKAISEEKVDMERVISGTRRRLFILGVDDPEDSTLYVV